MKKYKRNCDYCNKEFETNVPNKKYCNSYCAGKFRNEKRVEKMKNIENKTNDNLKIQVKGTQKFLGKEVPVIEGGFGEGRKVVLAKTIAEIHGIELRKVNELINNNLDEFDEGIDILDLKGDEDFAILAKDNGFYTQNALNASSNIYLLSEQGYIALVGLMRTEKAKELRKKFRREYFAMREIINTQSIPQTYGEALLEAGRLQIELEKTKQELDDEKNKVGIMEKELTEVQIKLKEKINQLKDGNHKLLTATQLIENLEIVGLTSTIFHKWLCKKGFGKYEVYPNEKRRTFQPNERFEKYIGKEGFSITGLTNKHNKVKVYYSIEMVNRIIDRYYNELSEFVDAQIEF